MGEKVVVLIGPTAVGKTKMSIQLAKRLNGEIINGDSMQVYKGLDIGTAKIRQEETEGIPHHLLDIKEPHESFSVAEFQTLARSLIKDITKRGKLPIIVGGTGLYIQSVIYDYQFSDAPSNDLYRQSLERCSPDELYEQLKRIDPLSAERIHPNNVRRVIRALEIYHCTGKTMTEWLKEQKRQLVYNVALIGLTMEREKLYARINQRVDQMIDQGLIEEVKLSFYVMQNFIDSSFKYCIIGHVKPLNRHLISEPCELTLCVATRVLFQLFDCLFQRKHPVKIRI